MGNINDSKLYDIHDLIRAWKKGWKEFAKYGPPFERWRGFSEKSNPELIGRVEQGLGELFSLVLGLVSKEHLSDICEDLDGVYRDGIIWRDSLGNSMRGSCSTGSAILYCINELWQPKQETIGIEDPEILRKITDAFSTSKTFYEALLKVPTKDGIIELGNRKGGFCNRDLMEPVIVTPQISKTIKLLGKAINNAKALEEAWWNTIWIAVEGAAHKFVEMHEKIEIDVPLEPDEINLVNEIMAYGRPKIRTMTDSEGKETKIIELEPSGNGIGCESDIELIGTMLLVQPAFVLSQCLQEKNRIPRYEKVCHAPSCGKKFYTKRETATACPGSQGNKKSKCALEWVRYKRYLQKISENPEKKWDDPKLVKQFIDYDNS